jgi:hypothetical protein
MVLQMLQSEVHRGLGENRLQIAQEEAKYIGLSSSPNISSDGFLRGQYNEEMMMLLGTQAAEH